MAKTHNIKNFNLPRIQKDYLHEESCLWPCQDVSLRTFCHLI